MYKGEEINEIPEGIVGFVYLIRNLSNGKGYVGKKTFYFQKTKQVKKKKKKIKVESDWKEYWSSSKTIQEEINKNGTKGFKREILYFCKNKSQMSYLELREQMDRRVMESDEYYNEYILVRIHKTKSLYS